MPTQAMSIERERTRRAAAELDAAVAKFKAAVKPFLDSDSNLDRLLGWAVRHGFYTGESIEKHYDTVLDHLLPQLDEIILNAKVEVGRLQEGKAK